MNDFAIWAAAHPYYWLCGLPVLSAVLGGLFWHAFRDARPGRRGLLYGAFAVLMAALFLWLALAVRQGGSLVAFDTALARALGRSASPELLGILSWFTYLGDRRVLGALALVMVLLLLLRRQWVLAVAAVAATAGSGGLNWVLKHLIQRDRPDFSHGFAHASGFSFPSGHASASMAVYGFACYLLLRLLPERLRPVCVALTAALVTAIGVSRVLLQVHYFSDVVAGFAVSALWLLLCITGAERGLRR
ncbi:phosphatase PAP2 family protein [Bordetella avium]|uniref:Membrane-associated phosphatase n=1 Tax=Bordetella avium (strain 197N) TaxID=360910 RepID=Q2KV31_BORA1|nr:phosphatase PAP2 family protein [Bordetella avium]AZY51918.1 phosphatase PAP2 family protein [Bordetella avium]RIQ17081.1 phosphatase PAP2 family protein [Bordetella avium]RIQ36193.1 phosphatase PAP2 family protein [Bordetella avium]RIQ39542.1 phosphatase PAP2 family protein [Bordetella avium]RIQ44341.1 phosphatase PAP2 family protein [Bordetella avium]